MVPRESLGAFTATVSGWTLQKQNQGLSDASFQPSIVENQLSKQSWLLILKKQYKKQNPKQSALSTMSDDLIVNISPAFFHTAPTSHRNKMGKQNS